MKNGIKEGERAVSMQHRDAHVVHPLSHAYTCFVPRPPGPQVFQSCFFQTSDQTAEPLTTASGSRYSLTADHFCLYTSK